MLIINNLEKKFGNFDAVKKINFSIKKNQTVALLGPNGCGKTTTIAMILGLITPTSGSIIINDQTLTKNHHYLSKMNFASPYVELPKKLKVIENLKVYAMMYEVKNLHYRKQQKIFILYYELQKKKDLKIFRLTLFQTVELVVLLITD